MFHENGQLKIQCEYNKDELDGEYKEWDEEGNLVLERFYVEGKLASI
jgi:antitoxin component YwqK of YwqJK toxin-antitoxin module